jgi:hypothetical protein
MSRGRGWVQVKIMEVLGINLDRATLQTLAYEVFGPETSGIWAPKGLNASRVAIESTRQALRSLIARGDVIVHVRESNGAKYYESTVSPKYKKRARAEAKAKAADEEAYASLKAKRFADDDLRLLAKICGNSVPTAKPKELLPF